MIKEVHTTEAFTEPYPLADKRVSKTFRQVSRDGLACDEIGWVGLGWEGLEWSQVRWGGVR